MMLSRVFTWGAVLLIACAGRADLKAADCNGNGIEDFTEITAGDVEDCNFNGVPDRCEGAPFGFPETGVVRLENTARGAVAADFDGDGLDDLALGYFGGVAIRLSVLGGNFADFESLDFPVGVTDPIAWDAGDVDGDGDVDLVVLEPSRLIVLFNGGDGTFDEERATDLVGRFAAFALADFNGDGAADAVLTEVRRDLAIVMLGGAKSAFSDPVEYSVGDDPRAVGVGDLNGDQALDVVVLNRVSADATLLVNDGMGDFTPSGMISELGRNAQRLVVADMSGDGLADVATGDLIELTVRLNEGALVFGAPFPLVTDGVNVVSVGSGDVDGDGDIDLIASYAQPPGFVAFVNDGTGLLSSGILLQLSVSSQVVVHDADADGANDLVLVSGADDFVTIAWNRPLDDIVPFEPPQAYATGGLPHTVDIGDLDGDGDLDLAVGNNTFRGLTTMVNDGNGVFTPRQHSSPHASGAFSIVIRDLDGNDTPDLVAANSTSLGVHFYLNNRSGAFFYKESVFFDKAPFHAAVGDVDDDGDADVIISFPGSNVIAVVFNDGTASFDRADEYPVGSTPRATVVVDLDNDGDLDIAASNLSSANVSVLENDGDGVYETAVAFPLSGSPIFIAAADMDLDGNIDLVTANQNREASILWNIGGNPIEFEPPARVDLEIEPRSLLVGDVNADGREDIVVFEESGPTLVGAAGGRIAIVLNRGGRDYSAPSLLITGSGPRFGVVGDVDGDSDVDVISANRRSLDVTVFLSQLSASTVADFLPSICTVREYFQLSTNSRSGGPTRRTGKYVLAARDDPSLHPALFQNVSRFRLHENFLASVFPEEFGFILEDPARYDEIIGRRATRDYYVGTLDLRQRDDGFLYTFNVVADTGFDSREALTQDEVGQVYDRMRAHFLLEPLAYAPNTQLARDIADMWIEPDFPVFVDNSPPPFQFEAYTLGLGYGRLRILTLEEFEVANREGRFTFQDGVVIEEVSPPDIEGVVGFVFTGGVQGELAHLPIRTARRGTPNAFVSNVREKFAEFEGELVRVEVFPENFFVTPISASEAEEFWEQIQRELPESPFIDASYTQLDSFLEMDLTGRSEGRYGGKASNLARLQREILRDGTLDDFIEPGFAIPIHYYLQFMQTNFRGAQSYEEYIQQLVTREDFRTDSILRFELLKEFRNFARTNGTVDDDLLQILALKIESVFSDLSTMVRFRSSSNAEDALVFNGAGLYESTSVCALDTLDESDRNASLCDPSRNSERTIERALKKVWASLWTFRAHEERSFYQIDPNDAVMGIAVTRAFLNEDANGVAFTGSARDVEDKRYVITAQVGEGSVVSPPAGTTVERTLLAIGDEGEVEKIIRSRASNQVASGVTVMGERDLRELARFMRRMESVWEFDLPENMSREQVILDFEFKVESGGDLAVKQVRPFLIPSPDFRTPTFELEIPGSTVVCATFSKERVGRALQEEYEFKSQVWFRSGVFELPTNEESFSGDLIAEVRFGPDRLIAQPLGEGRFEFRTIPEAGSQTSYTFTYTQDFVLPGGGSLELKIDNLGFVGRGAIALERRLLLNDHYNTFSLVMQATLDGSPVIAYSSCSYHELPRWELNVEVEGGTRISLVERFQPEERLTDTGRASLVEATVDLGNESQTVHDYWRLVYTARRHNVDVAYWVVLKPELTVAGSERPVRVVEVSGLDGLETVSYECPTAMVRYLDSDFNVIGTPTLASCVKETKVDSGPIFRRGEIDGNASVTIGDLISFLNYFFARGRSPRCLSSADANDDGRLDVVDGITILLHLFGGVSALPAPFAQCGIDPTPDELSCASFEGCA